MHILLALERVRCYLLDYIIFGKKIPYFSNERRNKRFIDLVVHDIYD